MTRGDARSEHDIAEQEAHLAARLQRIDPRARWKKPALRRGLLTRVTRPRVLAPLLSYALAFTLGFWLALLVMTP